MVGCFTHMLMLMLSLVTGGEWSVLNNDRLAFSPYLSLSHSFLPPVTPLIVSITNWLLHHHIEPSVSPPPPSQISVWSLVCHSIDLRLWPSTIDWARGGGGDQSLSNRSQHVESIIGPCGIHHRPIWNQRTPRAGPVPYPFVFTPRTVIPETGSPRSCRSPGTSSTTTTSSSLPFVNFCFSSMHLDLYSCPRWMYFDQCEVAHGWRFFFGWRSWIGEACLVVGWGAW